MTGRSGLAVLEISDGTTTVNLLANKNGFGLKDWRPALAGLRDGGTWHEGPYIHGRRLKHYVFDNTVETFDLTVNGDTQDLVIAETRKLRQLLQKGRDYWTSRWTFEPVWIKARGSNETNPRYAFIHDWATPNDANPHTTPFFNCDADTLINDLTLTLEHGMWQDVAPASANCLPANSNKVRHVYYVALNGLTEYIDLGSPATLDDRINSDFTVDAWVRLQPGAGVSPIVAKRDPGGTGWYFRVTTNGRLEAYATYSGTDAQTLQTSGDIRDGLWHHVAATFNTTTEQWIVWLDGANVSGSTVAGTVGYTSDAAIDIHIGRMISDYFDGDIGWCRMASGRLYTAGFTPPPRWRLPPNEGTILGIWIWNGHSSIVYNAYTPGSAMTGSLTSIQREPEDIWATDYDFILGYTDGAANGNYPSVVLPKGGCDLGQLFFENSHNYAELTHVFYFDTSVPSYSSNLLLSVLPFDLLPSPFGVGDMIYFINQSDREFSGPFNNLVLNLDVTVVAPPTYTFQYYNGAWVDLPVIYEDHEFNLQDGVYSVAWAVPSDWTTVTINGVTGYAVRLNISALTSPNPPSQTTQQIYTTTWPYLQVPSTSVIGDIPSIAKLWIQNLSDDDASGSGVCRNLDTMYLGLRSLSRGSDFTAYLNISDVHRSPYAIVNDASTGGLFVSSVLAPTGRCWRWTPPAAISDDLLVNIQFGNRFVINDYYGTYRVFLRGRTVSGAEEQLSFQISVGFMSSPEEGNTLWLSDIKPWVGSESTDYVDFGEVTIPPVPFRQDESFAFLYFHVHGYNSANDAKSIDLYDIILIPVDEWFASVKQFIDPTASSDFVNRGMGVLLDSIGNPKDPLRSFGISERGWMNHLYRADGAPVIFQSNADQRLWFFITSNVLGSALRVGYHDNFHSGKMEGVNRYFSMRGAG